MAGDWIKMRADLQTHPKVVRMASALKADRLRAVGGLHAVWCLFDAHSIDGTLDGYSPDTLDVLIGCPGFAEAMISVGWLIVSENSLCLPRFDDHNGKSAKRRAAEAARKKAVRNSSASKADKKRTREEKSNTPKSPPKKSWGEPPEGVDPKAWSEWAAYKRGSPAEQTVTKLGNFLRNYTPAEQQQIVDRSIRNAWKGLFEPDKSAAKTEVEDPETRMARKQLEQWEREHAGH